MGAALICYNSLHMEQETVYLSPPIEVVIHQAGIDVQKVETPDGNVNIIKFVTPFQMFTLRLSDEAVDILVAKLKSGVFLPPTGMIIK